jgi:hypothetical protein
LILVAEAVAVAALFFFDLIYSNKSVTASASATSTYFFLNEII